VRVIAAERLTRRYGRRTGIEALDLAVGPGELVGFLGPNGAGKTTTIRVLLGFLRPSAGRAAVFGLDSWRESPRIKRDVGYLPGDLRLYPGLSGLEHLRLFGMIRGRDLVAPGRALAERYQLELDVTVRRMSRGTRQKLGLVLALAPAPRLLVLDEPTASLDPLTQDELALHLRELAGRGCAVLFSSHTLSEVERLCDRVAIVREGRLVADETIESMRARADRAFTIRWVPSAGAGAIATPAFLEVTRRDARTWEGTLRGSAAELVRWAAAQPVEDLTVGRPDLDGLFRRHYRAGREEGA
jgi:ABC-2 type transport system ATP-binding protein